MEVLLPFKYPFEPPKVLVSTKIYHPNIDFLGRVCLDVIKKKWTPALQLKQVLLSVQQLLSDPQPDDFLNQEVAAAWKANKNRAERTAKQ